MRPGLRPLALLALTITAGAATGQEPVSGFARRIRGEVLRYHSPLPWVSDALLVRSLDASRSIEWESAAVPDGPADEPVRLVWLFGIEVDPDRHDFELAVNGEKWFTFRTPLTSDMRDWTVSGPDGAELRFRATMVDRFDDLMGFAELRMPRAACEPGKPVRLSVVGESAGSRTWYMTFAAPVEASASLTATPALRRGDPEPYRLLNLDVVYLGEPVGIAIHTSFGEPVRARLELGGNRIELRHSRVDAPSEASVRVEVEGRVLHVARCEIAPVRPWTVDLVQHTHTDIGYTRPQTEILPEHVRFIDTALDLCDQTDGFPDAAKFRWTCETSWAVREFLATRPAEQVERLRRRAREGRIEVTGAFLNVSGLLDEAGYAATLQPLRAIRAAGIPVTAAMKNDVNGAAWCLADWATDLGIEFLVMGQHGHRALIPFETPTCFWWESKAGERVLAYRADHYMTGNFWGLHTGKLEAVEPELLRYLEGLEAAGYPFDRVAVQFSGYPTDNAPPSTAVCEVVRRWNERFVWPRLRSSVASDFLRDVERRCGDELPVYRAAWPDWWDDGFGSAPRETAAARTAQARLRAVEGLLAFERLAGVGIPSSVGDRVGEIRDALAFYFEHTFGAAESIRDPFVENSVVQWAEKASYAWDAVKRTALLEEVALGGMAARMAPAAEARLLVFNPLGFERSGIVEVYADHEVLPIDRPFRLTDETGRALDVQLLRSRAEGSYWAVRAVDVPALGWRTWSVVVGSGGSVPERGGIQDASTLENARFRIDVDPDTGAIASWNDKARGVELVDSGADRQLGQLVHEALGNREQMEAFTLEDYERVAMHGAVVEGVRHGPVWDALTVRGELPGCDGVRFEIRLHHAEPVVELCFLVRKRRVESPEAMYVAFPFALDGARVVLETLGGVTSPEGGILPNTASDWQTVQGFVAAQAPAGQVVLTSPEIPLVQLGAIHTGEFQRAARVDAPHVFSWVSNNYWTTNFLAAWDGELRWRYVLTASADSSTGFAARFGDAQQVPFLARVLPARGGSADATSVTALPEGLAGVELVSAHPAAHGPGAVLLLREVDGHTVTVDVAGLRMADGPTKVSIVDAVERVLTPAGRAIELAPFASCFVLVEPAR